MMVFLTELLALYRRLYLFVRRDIWRTDLAVTSRLGTIAIYPLRVLLIVMRGFWFEHQGLLRASALTYSTLLSLVPILAFALAFLKGLGVHNLLEPFLIDRGVIGSEETVRMLLNYANNSEVRTVGGLVLATLVLTTVLGVGMVEWALNEIWGVHTEAPILRTIADYASVLVLGPVALLLATSINTRLYIPTFVTAWLGMRGIGEAVTLFSTVMSTI